MRFIPTHIHGMLDYLAGAFLVLAPNLLGFADLEGAPVWIPRILGVMVLLQAAITDCETGFVGAISMRMHLLSDYGISILLAASPWLFGFANRPKEVWIPHVVVGLAIFLVAVATEKEPYRHGTPRGARIGRAASS